MPALALGSTSSSSHRWSSPEMLFTAASDTGVAPHDQNIQSKEFGLGLAVPLHTLTLHRCTLAAHTCPTNPAASFHLASVDRQVSLNLVD